MIKGIINFNPSGLPNFFKKDIQLKAGIPFHESSVFYNSLQDKFKEYDKFFKPDVGNIKRWWGSEISTGKIVGINFKNLNALSLYCYGLSWPDLKKSYTNEELNLYNEKKKRKNGRVFAENNLLVQTFSDINSINWGYLLNNAQYISIGLFYLGSKILIEDNEAKNSFIKFFAENGSVNLYLPDVLGIYNKFGSFNLNFETCQHIIKTKKTFIDWHTEAKNSGQLKFFTLNRGFNYMYSEVINKDSSKLFLFSPYQNHHEKNNSPVLSFSSNTLKNKHISDFFANEKYLIDQDIKKEKENPLFLNKYLTWDISQDRVFVSLSLSCHGGCSFCYIGEIADKNLEKLYPNFAYMIARTIANDPRFIPGPFGTVVLFGGFTDPFKNSSHRNWTMEVIELLSKFDNYFHIATRFKLKNQLNSWVERISKFSKRVIINYSISQLSNKLIEVHSETENIDNRFIEAGNLIEKGFNVALYVRPVLPRLTLQDTPLIIENCLKSKIKLATIGGLYVNDKIITSLKSRSLEIEYFEIQKTKHLVLDSQMKLTKIENSNEVDAVRQLFSDANIEVFNSSMELIDSFRANVNKPIFLL